MVIQAKHNIPRYLLLQVLGKRRRARWRTAFITSLVLSCSFFFMLPGPTCAGTVLEDTAAQMQPGQWVDVTSAMGGSAVIGNLLQTEPGSHINEYADKGVWNPITREAFFVGASHGSSPKDGTAEKFIRFSDTANAWDIAGPDVSPVTYQAHSYQHNAINVANGDIYNRLYNTTTVRRFRGGVWSDIPAIPTGSKQVAGALEAFPERNGMMFIDGDWGVWWFNYATNAWIQVAHTNGGNGGGLPKFPMGSYHNVGVYNPVHKIILFGGGNGSAALYRFDRNGTLTTETTAPTSVAVNSTIFTVDPASGDYLLFSNSRGFWKYNPATKVWTAMPSSQYPPFFTTAADGPALGTVAFPISTYGVVMFTTWNFSNSKIYLYKHATTSSSTTIPPPPTSLTIN